MLWALRTGLTLLAWFALWELFGWRHWTSVLGAVAVAWAVTYFAFGALYNDAAAQLDGALTRARSADDDDEDREADGN